MDQPCVEKGLVNDEANPIVLTHVDRVSHLEDRRTLTDPSSAGARLTPIASAYESC